MLDRLTEVPDISHLDRAFPARALEWMPAEDEIPEEFRRGQTEWNTIGNSWMVHGLPENVEFYANEGVDPEKAFNVISATMNSYAPRLQHKEAAVAFMLFSWFEKVENWRPDA